MLCPEGAARPVARDEHCQQPGVVGGIARRRRGIAGVAAPPSRACHGRTGRTPSPRRAAASTTASDAAKFGVGGAGGLDLAPVERRADRLRAAPGEVVPLGVAGERGVEQRAVDDDAEPALRDLAARRVGARGPRECQHKEKQEGAPHPPRRMARDAACCAYPRLPSRSPRCRARVRGDLRRVARGRRLHRRSTTSAAPRAASPPASPQASFLQRLRPTSRTFRPLLPLYPHAVESLDLRGYDVVVSSSSAWAHGVLIDPGAVHVCYCHNPFRYAWSEREATLEARNLLTRPALRVLLSRWRQWDWIAAQRVDAYVANSAVTAARIRRYFGRDAKILHPPVELVALRPGPGRRALPGAGGADGAQADRRRDPGLQRAAAAAGGRGRRAGVRGGCGGWRGRPCG